MFLIFLISLFSAILTTWLLYYFAKILSDALFKFANNKITGYSWPTLSNTNTLANFLGWAGYQIGANSILKALSVIIISATIIVYNKALVYFACLLIVGIFIRVLMKTRSRKRKFSSDLPDAIETLSKSMKAGYTLRQAFVILGQETRSPCKEIFGTIVRGYDRDMPLAKIIEALEPQIDLPAWHLLSKALLIHEEKGGNLLPVLDNIASSIRQNTVIEQELRVSTATGRISAVVLTGALPFVFTIIFIISPNYFETMLDSAFGQKMLITAFILQLLGFYMIYKITSIKE